jgi:hypothetical protein
MADPNLSEIVTTTLRNRREKLADNVLTHNPVLNWLNRKGNVQLADGGQNLVEELEYAENSTFKYYSGYEVLDITPSTVFSAAEFDWKQAATVVSISGLDIRRNSGKSRMIHLMEKRIANAEKTMANNLSTGVFSDGTGTSGKQIGGLQHLVADSPSTGTVGSINRANFSFWQNASYDMSSDYGEAMDADNVLAAMNAAWLEVVRGSDHPDLIVAGSNYFGFFRNALSDMQRITSEKDAAAGFESLAYYGTGGKAAVVYDPGCNANRMYMLNSDYLFWRPHKDANSVALDDRNSVNQDAVVVPIIFMGNMTMSNASLQQVIKA